MLIVEQNGGIKHRETHSQTHCQDRLINPQLFLSYHLEASHLKQRQYECVCVCVCVCVWSLSQRSIAQSCKSKDMGNQYCRYKQQAGTERKRGGKTRENELKGQDEKKNNLYKSPLKFRATKPKSKSYAHSTGFSSFLPSVFP